MEVTRTARLAHIFKEICDMITSYKGKQMLIHSHKHHHTHIHKNLQFLLLIVLLIFFAVDCIVLVASRAA